MLPLVWGPKVVQTIETESRRVVSRDWGRVNRDLLLYKYTVLYFQDGKVLEMWFTTMRIYLTLGNCALEMVKKANFMSLCLFFCNHNWKIHSQRGRSYRDSPNCCWMLMSMSGAVQQRQQKKNTFPNYNVTTLLPPNLQLKSQER